MGPHSVEGDTMSISNPAHSDTRLSPDLADEDLANAISLTRHAHPNVLVIGDDDAVDQLLERIRQNLVPPVAHWNPQDHVTLPVRPFRTLIVQNVDVLTPTQQEALTALCADVQVI